MSSNRQLAVIMFTDVVGYTSLMGSNEQLAIQLLDKNRGIHQSAINKHKGNFIKELGDGFMISFSSVSEAVHAALNILENSIQLNEYHLRIGIHMGEVVMDNNDVFGDGVNIASRIQSAAKPDTIYVSETIFHNINNKIEFKTEFVDELKLKNVSLPVKVYEVKTSKSKNVIPEFQRSNNENDKSIAVLPFVNMSNDPDQEYFSDGMSEEILNSLAHISELKVAGRTSSFQFKGKNIDLRDVGNTLGVNNVLEGSVRKHGNQLRITAQLINVADGFHLWSERFDRTLDDIFAIQDEIALAITKKLKLTLLSSKSNNSKKPATQNTTAHSYYLKGRHEWNNRTKDGFRASIDLFKQAINEDPEYSLAYAGIADSYLLLNAYHIISPDQSIREAKVAAEKSLEINPKLSEGFEALGHIELLAGFDWKSAEDNYRKAIELNPNFATARQRYALLLKNWGRDSDACNEIFKARELDPLSTIINTDVGLIQLQTGDTDAAIKTCLSVLEIKPGFPVALFILGLAYEEKGMIDLAIANFELSVKTSRKNPIGISALAHALAGRGEATEAEAMLQQLLKLSKEQFVSPYCLATIFAGLGDQGNVFKHLNNAVDERSVWQIHLHFSSDPRFKSFKNDQRYKDLLSRINLG